MQLRHFSAVITLLALVFSAAAQTSPATSPATSTTVDVPRLIRFSGTASDEAGKPMTGPVGITFALYREQQGGAPLWIETQNVQADSTGHYIALLGSARPDGVPLSLFSSAEVHWIGTQISGHAEQPRVLLLSVPYALKAADAETLGGFPASAFIQANPARSETKSAPAASSKSANAPPPATITGAGTTDYIPLWTSSSALGNSLLFQTGGNVGVGTTAPGAKLDSSGASIAVRGTTSGATGVGVVGKATSTTGVNYGVKGSSASPAGGSAGVSGNETAATGAVYGVYGTTSSTTTNAMGVSGFEGAKTGQVYGVNGNTSSAGNGAAGVNGYATAKTGQIYGVSGSTNSATQGASGVSGYEGATTGVVYGVSGGTASATTSAAGVSGYASSTTGQVYGVYGSTNSTTNYAAGLDGYEGAVTGYVFGVFGAAASSTNYSAGVSGSENSTTGVVYGTVGFSGSATGGAAGVNGYESATTGQVYGVYGSTPSTTASAAGVSGFEASTTGQVYGVSGSTNSPTGSGVAGYDGASSGGTGGSFTAGGTSGAAIGVFGQTSSPAGAGGAFTNLSGGTSAVIVGNGAAYAQVFSVDASGNLTIKGKLTKGSGSFKIDDPLDPAHKYLSHSFVESPDMMNVYNGNITTDTHGVATVVLPQYFEALNRDFRYQLTVIGQFAQAIVKQEIANNRFTIKTSKPSVKVSWQVTGIRHDAYANAYRIPTEEEKPPQEQGHYLHPELFEAPAQQAKK